MSVKTRFAPSPTGFLHIGGARTALFNYLFARHHGGEYLLRIEDTDRTRSTLEAVEAIHQGLKWLGLEGDRKAVYQSDNSSRHIEVAHKLLEEGHAYRCYLTPEELARRRIKARSSGKKIISPWRDTESSEQEGPFTIRLKMPVDGEMSIDDHVQGRVTIANATLDDLVMIRGDGTPTYMLAVVVDDHDMGITHIIRGDDHLNNAFRQSKIIEAMGWKRPEYAHIPLIHGSDGKKLSKRHGALEVEFYKKKGFLPEAMCNYLLRLGWSHGDDEIISLEQAERWFNLDAIGKSPARFDNPKLLAVNTRYMRQMSAEDPTEFFFHSMKNKNIEPHIRKRLEIVASAFIERAQLVTGLDEKVEFLTHDDVPKVEPEAKALLNKDTCARLRQFAEDLPDDDMTPEQFKIWFTRWLDEKNFKMRDIAPGLRAAITGKTQTPDIILIASALGVEQLHKRIKGNCQI
jgi:glutamyl-tRNA synthetase